MERQAVSYDISQGRPEDANNPPNPALFSFSSNKPHHAVYTFIYNTQGGAFFIVKNYFFECCRVSDAISNKVFIVCAMFAFSIITVIVSLR